jgi:very-short-patch-repair endonuclease
MPLRRQPAGIVRGQPISSEKLAFAKSLHRAMTSRGARAVNELRQNRLEGIHFRRQQVISGFIVGFYSDAARIAVELDGAYHDAAYDGDRDRELARVGVKVLRIENAELRRDLVGVLDQICERVRERIATLT